MAETEQEREGVEALARAIVIAQNHLPEGTLESATRYWQDRDWEHYRDMARAALSHLGLPSPLAVERARTALREIRAEVVVMKDLKSGRVVAMAEPDALLKIAQRAEEALAELEVEGG